MMKYKKEKIQYVLNWQSQKEIDPLKIDSLKIDDEKKYPFYGQATQNNGIIDYLNLDEKVLNNKEGKPTILIHSNNQNIVYLETPFYLKDGHGATSVLQNEHLNELNAMYIISCIKKVITEKFTYNEKATKIALKNTEIELPVDLNDNIDYQYMEDYIINLKQGIIQDVNGYLNSIGLSNLKLNCNEETALNRLDNKSIEYKGFPFEKLFISQTGDTDIQQKDLNNEGYFVVSSGEKNNGIIGKTTVNAKITDKNTITIDMFGFANFRDFKYKMVTHARVFSIAYKDRKLSIEEGLYFVSHMRFLREVFSYSDMASWEKLKKKELYLPVDKNGNIDFDFINNIIRAKQKIILNDLKI